ncbi:SDR family NAD(P)-dependent oxidoreductase [Brevibacterium marinum]|uniref:NAD(P)-dependent dehydrogenase (Short-subunit alcohol dehydrogenase family) n=1 Tax=Brevibacterium marinum TaxID=418643 RepID=A0A846RWR6_9MICO|nr:SDR family oxidoreductase [Brevibacterium marinum]NJC55063.1 NAD(P)-dependent dehydrogenase (short-subunit alcohol dehydrogenase family) [Brevibacterium marinum]
MIETFRPHVLITGAASGIGKEIACQFAEQGAQLSLVDFNEESLHSVADDLRRGGAEVNSITADLRDPRTPVQVIESAFVFGEVHVLINSAGVYPAVPLLDITAEVWDAVQSINVRAPQLLTVEFAKRMNNLDEGLPLGYPAVVNISSGAALRARPGAAPYTTSKAALEMVTKSSALELGPMGVRVNAVAPGFVVVDSELNRLTDDYVSKVSANPLGRKGRPDDIARAVLWLASPAAEWITGEILRVDGGSATGALNLPVHWPETRTEIDDEPATMSALKASTTE